MLSVRLSFLCWIIFVNKDCYLLIFINKYYEHFALRVTLEICSDHWNTNPELFGEMDIVLSYFMDMNYGHSNSLVNILGSGLGRICCKYIGYILL